MPELVKIATLTRLNPMWVWSVW